MESNGIENSAKKYSCLLCSIYTAKKTDFVRHCHSIKHKNRKMESNGIENNEIENVLLETSNICDHCGKEFASQSGLWKHEKKCPKNANALVDVLLQNNKELKDTNKELQNTMLQIIEKNDEKLTKLVIELCKNMNTNNSHNTTNNVNSNNTFNLQVFLNETCKDALNLSDFIKTVKVGFDEIERIGNIGYVDGISELIIKNLNQLGVEKRPIHCTDAKRQTMYIKEDNEWEKEDANMSHLQKLVDEVQRINLRQLPLWREKHPGCLTSNSKYTSTYNNMSQELMGGHCNKVSLAAKDNKIMSKIIKNVVIDKTFLFGK